MMYSFNPDMTYYVNISSIQVHDKQNHLIINLDYPEAAVFDLLLKKIPADKLIRMIAKICPEKESHAENIFRSSTDFLIQHNIIIPVQNLG